MVGKRMEKAGVRALFNRMNNEEPISRAASPTMGDIQVGLLGADRSDGADTVLVNAREDVYHLVCLSLSFGIERHRVGEAVSSPI